MAEEKKAAPVAEQKAKKPKKPGIGNRIAKFFRDYKSEFKKIVWASWPDTRKKSIMVIVVIVVSAAGIFVLETAASRLLTGLAGLI